MASAAPSSRSSAAAAAASAPPPAPLAVSIGAASTFVSTAAFLASLDASDAMARASASAASIVSLISKTFFVSSALPTPSHAARRSRIIEPSPAASVAFDCAYSANCCLATCSLRSPSAASDSACARAISALSIRSAASSPMAPSPSWSSKRDSSPAAMVDAAAARDCRSGSGCRWMSRVRSGVPRCGARRAGRGRAPAGGGRFPPPFPADGTFHKKRSATRRLDHFHTRTQR